MEARQGLDDAALGRDALAVLDANWTGRATMPAPGIYPHQWSWDSALVALGLARSSPARARRELLGLFRGQWASGMVPHIVFNPAYDRAYFPGPEVWRSHEHAGAPRGVATSALTQPPLHAFAVWWSWRHGRGDREDARRFVRRMWPLLAAQHAHLAATRDLGGAGLAAIVHPWESGMDDSPAWDAPLAAVPAGGRPHHARSPHERYVWLALGYRESGYADGYLRDEHPFAVEDPVFNAAWLASSAALADLAPVAGADPRPYAEAAERIRAALIDRLWSAPGFFAARDLRTGRKIPVLTVGGFCPLLDPGLPSAYVNTAVEVLQSPRFIGASGYPVPSCDTRTPEFDRSRYWRGPSWAGTNWLLWRAAVVHGQPVLADLLAASTLRLVRQSGFRECFDPFDGTGRGCRDFSCTAALTLDLLAAMEAREAG
ncbi:MGH1-like glycoside hydrolase domain-containing protein [Bailinhaonella thermotolerans]|uniref:Mannosylglycerate hydrolase MGH1-like glycoside hydrolase domain-containing protein n=1 Tax=Bailinhaonella thermotolerans TaxID=1070861 RepID=A0A3A4A6M8_9ACTN|nr:hypothetical protein [Bailinhaonella thermotolerans]RJL21452.1 hypothetical protein D5H75_37455 [Bailinhaonella thermotolerans]